MDKKQDQGRRAQRLKRRRRWRTGFFVFAKLASLMKKKQDPGRRTQRLEARRKYRRTGFIVFAGLAILVLGAFIFFGTNLFGTNLISQPNSGGVVGRVADPTVSGAPEAVKAPDKEKTTADEQTNATDQASTDQASTDQASTDEQTTADQTADAGQYADAGSEDNTPAAAPSDPTMTLSIPKLGISGALVSGSEAALESGVEDVNGYPWLPGSNTYIAGHRLGFPGTGSDHIFYNLPSMAPGDDIYLTDSNGHTYTYQVNEILQVDPTDLGVIGPTGTDMVSLQTCIEDYGDFTTLGPDWNVRLIVRANKVA